MNANLNAYYNRIQKAGAFDSEAIRKTYLAKARRRALSELALSPAVWNIIFALKATIGVLCAFGFFAVIGSIESGALSPVMGIFCAVLIALLESLCFIPLGKRPKSVSKRLFR